MNWLGKVLSMFTVVMVAVWGGLAWNEYLIPLVMTIGKPNLRTLTVGVVKG